MAGALSGVCQENQERWPQISSYKQYPGFLSARYFKKKQVKIVTISINKGVIYQCLIFIPVLNGNFWNLSIAPAYWLCWCGWNIKGITHWVERIAFLLEMRSQKTCCEKTNSTSNNDDLVLMFLIKNIKKLIFWVIRFSQKGISGENFMVWSRRCNCITTPFKCMSGYQWGSLSSC